jgi:flagellar motility protein MotE (MotC chaperone)
MDQVDAYLGEVRERLKKLEQRMDAQYNKTEELIRKIGNLENAARGQTRQP